MTLTIDLPEEKTAVLNARTEAEGISAEQYVRQVLEHALETGPAGPPQPMSEFMQEVWGDMPEDVRAKFARDGASQVDHYVYGLPKRDL